MTLFSTRSSDKEDGIVALYLAGFPSTEKVQEVMLRVYLALTKATVILKARIPNSDIIKNKYLS